MLISDLIEPFKRYLLLEKNVSSKYVRGILRTVRLLDTKTPQTNIKQFNTETIRYFLCNMREQRMWSAKTFRSYRQHLKSFFDFAKKRGLLKINPVDDIEKPRLPKRLPRCLTKKQVLKLTLETQLYSWSRPIEYHRNLAIIFCFLYTGIRLSELLNLKTHEVNFEELYIFISKGKGQKDRYVPIHPKLFSILKFYIHERKRCLSPSSYFFTSFRSSKPLSQKNLYAIIHKLARKCDFYFSPHILRHTFAKLSLEANLNPYKLKEILGHSNISTTQIYMSVSTENIRKSFSKLDLL